MSYYIIELQVHKMGKKIILLNLECVSKLVFWHRLTWVVPEKGPYNGCGVVRWWKLLYGQSL